MASHVNRAANTSITAQNFVCVCVFTGVLFVVICVVCCMCVSVCFTMLCIHQRLGAVCAYWIGDRLVYYSSPDGE